METIALIQPEQKHNELLFPIPVNDMCVQYGTNQPHSFRGRLKC